MTNDPDKLSTIAAYWDQDLIYVGNGVGLLIMHTRNINQGHSQLKDVFVVPEFQKNLLDVGKITSNTTSIFKFN